MRLSRLLEDLDDKDEFQPSCWCAYPDAQGREVFDPEYHTAHTAASAAEMAVNDQSDTAMVKAYNDAMAQYGFVYDVNQDDWIKPLKEDLDDVDKFEIDCMYCKEQDVLISLNQGISADRPDPEEFHEIHSAARRAALKLGAYGSPEYKSEYEDKMNWRGYYYVPGSHGSYWVKE